MSAAHWKLDNLIAVVDVNNQQADGPSTQITAFEPLVDKLKAFGWFVQNRRQRPRLGDRRLRRGKVEPGTEAANNCLRH